MHGALNEVLVSIIYYKVTTLPVAGFLFAWAFPEISYAPV
jgi:hypothetical protein